FVVETVCRGERGLDARQAALAFERLQQCRFFSTDIGTGASVHPHIGGDACCQDVPADVASGSRFDNRLFQDPGPEDKFAPYVYVGGFCSDRVAGEHDTFQNLVGISLNELPILECARLALVRVATEIARALIALGQEAPFHTGREACATTPPKP